MAQQLILFKDGTPFWTEAKTNLDKWMKAQRFKGELMTTIETDRMYYEKWKGRFIGLGIPEMAYELYVHLRGEPGMVMSISYYWESMPDNELNERIFYKWTEIDSNQDYNTQTEK